MKISVKLLKYNRGFGVSVDNRGTTASVANLRLRKFRQYFRESFAKILALNIESFQNFATNYATKL